MIEEMRIRQLAPADRRVHRRPHDRHRVNEQNFPGVTDTLRLPTPNYLRLNAICPGSSPHRSAILRTGISTFPRFPPWRLVQHLPPSLVGLGQVSTHRQVSDDP
jgi:hypothetical protein